MSALAQTVRVRSQTVLELVRRGERRVASAWMRVVPGSVRRAGSMPLVHGAVVVGVVALLISSWGVTSYNAYVAQLVAIYAIATLGLNIPAGFGGALSLGQGASFAVGAYAVAILAGKHGWPLWAALPAALALGFALGALMGAPAGRFGVIGLAMVSLGVTLVVGDLIVQADTLTGGNDGISSIFPTWSFGGTPPTSLWLVPGLILAIFLLTYVLHSLYRTSRIGRASLAIKDEPLGAAALGVSSYWVQVAGFALGTAVGGLAGGLFAYLTAFISPASVGSDLSILFLVMVVLGGSGSRIGPVIGAAILGIVPLVFDQYAELNIYVYGGLLIVLMLVRPKGLVSRTTARVPNPLRLERGGEDAEPDAPAQSRDRHAPGDAPLLAMRGVSRSFGGVSALRAIDLEVRPGEVLGLIGPNGSGKTTLLNVISGFYPPDGGEIVFGGERIDGLTPARIQRRGIARTFQTPKLFPSLSIAEHIVVGAENGGARQEAQQRAGVLAARELMRTGGLDSDDPAVMGHSPARLSHGQLRFLEMAIAAYRVPRLLLLDEPAAGLSASEIAELESVVRRLAERGTAVIIVEHHLDLVRSLADRITVLNLGEILWSGEPDALHDAEEVRVAYLGVEA